VHQCTAMYGAVKPIHTAYNDAFSSHARKHTYVAVCPRVCEENANSLKAGNRALESGFMMQRASRRPLPTGHHSNDLVPLPWRAPFPSPSPFPTTTLYYVTSLDHHHLICQTITAGGCVERCADCSPSNHAWRDSLCRCRPRHLARHVSDNIAD